MPVTSQIFSESYLPRACPFAIFRIFASEKNFPNKKISKRKKFRRAKDTESNSFSNGMIIIENLI